MSLATLPTNPDIYDERGPERAGEFLHATPETANANPANTTGEFQIPQTDEILTTGNFAPVPAAPYVPEVDYHADRAAAVVEAALEAERRHVTEITNAGTLVGMRGPALAALNSQTKG